MTIESDGVITEVSRDYEPTIVDSPAYTTELHPEGESPQLAHVAASVAGAAYAAHRVHVN